MSDTLCVIPARGGSKRLPNKNIRELCGKPMLGYAVEAAMESGVFERICVSTDSEEIAAVAEEFGADVPFMRPAELATDSARFVDVCLHAIEFFESEGESFETVCVLLPSTPLRTGADIRGAYERFQSHDEAEFLMGVTDYLFSPFEAMNEADGYLQNFWEHQEYVDLQSQDLPDLVVDNGAIYMGEIEAFRREQQFRGGNVIGYPMPLKRSIDIDTPQDFELAKAILESTME